MAKKKSNHTGAKVALGIGAGLAVAAAAGTAWLYGTEKGRKTKKKLSSWMLKAKGEVLEKIEKMGDVTEEKYHAAVGQVMNKYKKMKNVSASEVAVLEADLKKHWKNIYSMVSPKKKASVRKRPRTAKKK